MRVEVVHEQKKAFVGVTRQPLGGLAGHLDRLLVLGVVELVEPAVEAVATIEVDMTETKPGGQQPRAP